MFKPELVQSFLQKIFKSIIRKSGIYVRIPIIRCNEKSREVHYLLSNSRCSCGIGSLFSRRSAHPAGVFAPCTGKYLRSDLGLRPGLNDFLSGAGDIHSLIMVD